MSVLRLIVAGAATREDLLAVRADIADALAEVYAAASKARGPAHEAAIRGVRLCKPDALYGESEEFRITVADEGAS